MNTRTEEEKKERNFNYYLVFGIKPNEKDKNDIEKKINYHYNPTKGTFPRGHRMLELKGDAINVMCDQLSRDIEFEKAKLFKLDDVHKVIVNIARSRKELYKSDFEKAADKSEGWLEAIDIEKKCDYLTKQGITIIDDTTGTLDFFTYKKIKDDLEKIGKTDLYDIIGLPKNAPFGDLDNAIKKANSDLKGRTDPKSAAISRICGLAATVFKNNDSRKNYDIYLDTKDIWDEFDDRKAHNFIDMSRQEFIAYIERAKKALNTSNNNDVKALLATRLRNLQISIAGGGELEIDIENCPYCGKAYANNNNPKACPHCHEPLEIVCWNCGGKAPFTDKNKTCPSCEAAKDHNSRFAVIVKKIDSLLVQPGTSISDIQTELNNLKNLLTDYKKVSTSKLAKKIAEYQEKVDKKIQEEETVGKAYKEEYEKIQELVNLKKFMTASGAVDALKKKYPIYNIIKTDALSASILSVVSRAKQHADKAKTFTAQNNEEAAVSEIDAALNLSIDYIEANQIISKFPPRVPDIVNAIIKEGAAVITWSQNKPQKLVAYTVIRKNGSRPTSITDGAVVASGLSINFFEDKTIVSDTPYYYAVFSSRLGVNSQIICTSAPIITYFDVSNIRQEIVSGKIVVKWETPLNVSEVEVIRKKGLVPPNSREDGQKIPVKNKEMFEDSDFDKAGNSYLFVCAYKNDKGISYSKGVIRTFKAFEELRPLTNIKIEQNSATSFTLKCDKVVSGKRGIYYSTQAANCKTGSSLQITEFKNLYKNLNEATLINHDENTIAFNLPPDKAYHVYPIICNEQLLIASEPVVVNTMIGISQITYTETKDDITITGKPHTFAKTIIAKISNTDFPSTLNSDGEKITVTKEEFVDKGLHRKLKMNADSYITIFAETENENIKSTTYGVRLDKVISLKEKVTVRYTLKYTASASKSFPIKIDFQSDVPASIPELMLVKGNPRPLNKNEGQLVDKTPVLTLKKGLFSGGRYTESISIKSTPVAVNTKFALFLAADNSFLTLKEVGSL